MGHFSNNAMRMKVRWNTTNNFETSTDAKTYEGVLCAGLRVGKDFETIIKQI